MLGNLKAKAEFLAQSGNYGKVVVEPLDKGMGTTVGNALRRVLLSQLPGAAVTWVRIEGVQHEFSTIPHVKEDVTEFLLNVKGLRWRAPSDRPGRVNLDVSGEGEVTAADIQPSPDFEIVNPELHLATLDSPEARLEVEFNVERGKGYIPAAHVDGQPIGVLPVDAIFTPVLKAAYSVEPTRVGTEEYERLAVEVWTDGTISALEAVNQSAEILIQHFSLVAQLGKAPELPLQHQPLAASIPPDKYNIPLEQLSLSSRTLNCLKRGRITKVGEVLGRSTEELLALRNFGQKSLEELRARLRDIGLLPPEEKTEEAPAPEAAPAEAEKEEGAPSAEGVSGTEASLSAAGKTRAEDTDSPEPGDEERAKE